jgi:hypothetical protein
MLSIDHEQDLSKLTKISYRTEQRILENLEQDRRYK